MTLTNHKNLTDPIDILYSIKKKGGSLARLAEESGFSKAYLSMTMHGLRNNPKIIRLFANFLDCPVRGVKPDSLTNRE